MGTWTDGALPGEKGQIEFQDYRRMVGFKSKLGDDPTRLRP